MIYFYGHIGFGDLLLTNAIVRYLAKYNDHVLVACWPHYETSARFMYRDLDNVDLKIVHTEREARDFTWEHKMLKLGWGGDHSDFDCRIFDQEFYRQSGVPFSQRWDGFKVMRDQEIEIKCGAPFIFVHDDHERGFVIDRIQNLPEKPIVCPRQTPNIFQYLWMLENADEIHCINSSFLILSDSVPTPNAQKMVLHHYARQTDYPLLKKNWIILS